jgi:uncharacterized protein YdeI (YjbR/CyaY-like superfamily)
MRGEFMLSVSAEVRERSGVELDTDPREVSVPPDFAEALDRDADAGRFFEGLSYSDERRFVMGIEDAKTAETRQRRIAKAVDALREGRAR